MDKMTQILDIPSIKNDTNFWMVRAKRGFFFDEFIRNEFIAIGWNSVTKAMISQNLTRSQSDRLKASIKATYDESKPGTSLNKCIRFCYELKAGDIAVIVDNNRVAFAYIGEYYEEQSPTLTVELEKEVHQQIEKANPNTDTFTCPYIKRRKITLNKVLTADDTISPYLQSAIARNWHSLSDLNEYAELVLSGCFDTVLFKDKLTVTFRVKRKEEINVLDLANFVLCAARLLSDDKPETVQVKTTLHSPGDVILQIWNFAQENAFPLLIWNTSQLFWESENREQKIPHAACVWDQTLFFFSCGLRRSVPSGSSSRTLTAPATPCALVSMTSPPGGITMSASIRTVWRVEFARHSALFSLICGEYSPVCFSGVAR